MKKRVKDIVIIALGWFLLVLGVAGLFLPVLQGVLFILIGLALLSKKSRWAKNLLERLKKRYPELYTKTREFRRQSKLYIKRLLRNFN